MNLYSPSGTRILFNWVKTSLPTYSRMGQNLFFPEIWDRAALWQLIKTVLQRTFRLCVYRLTSFAQRESYTTPELHTSWAIGFNSHITAAFRAFHKACLEAQCSSNSYALSRSPELSKICSPCFTRCTTNQLPFSCDKNNASFILPNIPERGISRQVIKACWGWRL